MVNSIYADCAGRYTTQISAEALFVHSSQHNYVKGLRVLLPDLSLEFTDGSYIGTDPLGQLYYNDVATLKTANKYVSDTARNPADKNQLVAWVKFYKDSTLVAEFLGNDYFGVVEAAGMVGYEHSGYWQPSSIDSQAGAHLKKEANSNSVTLDISKKIKRIATMTTNDPELKAAKLDIPGALHYGDLDDVSKGIYVSYANDRLIFYHDDFVGKDFTAYPFLSLAALRRPSKVAIIGVATVLGSCPPVIAHTMTSEQSIVYYNGWKHLAVD
ncbi:hypothetical protein GGX14DRAFT_651111 [Mycena pura]|uniref:Uncharacterized protein n=1 Tax=Mycena pura TaxID=153505 RepID=A0AAD6YNS5_9AGAR|nr:hypothetical protein GGX14DRAFT_651111 [Mycena pura]